MGEGGEEAAEERLHALHYEVEVTLQLETVIGEDCLKEVAEAEVYVAGSGRTQSRTTSRAEYCDASKGTVDVPLGYGPAL